MRPLSGLLGFGLALWVVVSACSHRPADDGSAPPEPAAPIAKPLTSVEHYRRIVAEQRGKVVMVNFWATWCGPCVKEFPELIKLRDAYADRGLVLVTISADLTSDVSTKVEPFLVEHRATDHAYVKQVPDDNEFIEAIRPEWDGTLPATFVYDRSGNLAKFLTDAHEYTEFEAVVKPLL